MGFSAKGNVNDDKMDFSPVPVGDYKLALVKAERKESQTAGNFYLNLQFSVVGGDYKKRVIFAIFNIENSNEVAQKIGRGDLSDLMIAVGVGDLKSMWDVKPLLNKPFKAAMGIKTDAQYGDKNIIKKYYPSSEDDSSSSSSEPWDDVPEKPKKKKKKGKKKKNKE